MPLPCVSLRPYSMRLRPPPPLLQEEIFGPLLPVLAYDKLEEAMAFINQRQSHWRCICLPKPTRYVSAYCGKYRLAGGCVNDTIMHLAGSRLPFGGVGDSGMGQYHGKAGFDTFTHYKGVLIGTSKFDLPLRYPPYDRNLGLIKKFIK